MLRCTERGFSCFTCAHAAAFTCCRQTDTDRDTYIDTDIENTFYRENVEAPQVENTCYRETIL